jgi:cytochrome oxidase assembly protein ShyY1
VASTNNRESYSPLKSLIALALIALCLVAANWQYERGVARHARNFHISTHIDAPILSFDKAISNLKEYEWQRVQVKGYFDSKRQILLRNSYSEGVYGFEVLTAFTTFEGETFWVDCGWVKAPNTAVEKPVVPELPIGDVTITGRLRLTQSIASGKFFAMPGSMQSSLVDRANAADGSTGISAKYYLDLLEGSHSLLTPDVPAQLPELSDGPHMAYAIQWIFFGLLVGYGRFLIYREVKKSTSDEALV